MKTKWIQPHDAAAELETLQDELRYLKWRYRHASPNNKAFIAQMIGEVQRDIKRNTVKKEARKR